MTFLTATGYSSTEQIIVVVVALVMGFALWGLSRIIGPRD
jgi:hypothetical protein